MGSQIGCFTLSVLRMFTFCRLFSSVQTICQIRFLKHSSWIFCQQEGAAVWSRSTEASLAFWVKKQRPFFTEGLWEQTEALTCKQLMTADQHGLRFKHLMKTVITYFNISVSHSSAQFDVSASCSDKQMTSPMTRWILGNGGLGSCCPSLVGNLDEAGCSGSAGLSRTCCWSVDHWKQRGLFSCQSVLSSPAALIYSSFHVFKRWHLVWWLNKGGL